MVGSTKCSIYDKQSLGIVQFHCQRVANLNQLFQQVSETGGSQCEFVWKQLLVHHLPHFGRQFWGILHFQTDKNIILLAAQHVYILYRCMYIHIPMTFPNCFFPRKDETPMSQGFLGKNKGRFGISKSKSSLNKPSSRLEGLYVRKHVDGFPSYKPPFSSGISEKTMRIPMFQVFQIVGYTYIYMCN